MLDQIEVRWPPAPYIALILVHKIIGPEVRWDPWELITF